MTPYQYTHSSLLKTVQEMLQLSPLLGDAATSGVNDLGGLFMQFP